MVQTKQKNKKIGYARISTREQQLDLQIDALKKAGCIKIFSDKNSGSKIKREGLEKALAELEKGDVLIVWKLDRLGRSIRKLIELTDELQKKGIQFHSITDGIDTTTVAGRFFFHVMAAMAEMERELIIERTKAGLTAARARGKKGGRKRKKKNDPKVLMAKKMYLDKSMSITDICASLNISRSTFYRYINLK